MSLSTQASVSPASNVIVAGPEPVPPALRGPLAFLQEAGARIISFPLNGAAPAEPPGATTADALLLVIERADKQSLSAIESFSATGPPVVVLRSSIPPDFERMALERGATETVALDGLDGPGLSAVIRRAVARGSYARHAAMRADLFRTLVEMGAGGLAVLDQQLVIRYVSEAGARILGLPREAWQGRSVLELLEPSEVERAVDEASRAIQKPGTPITVMHRLRHGDGSWHQIEAWVLSLLQDPVVQGLAISFRDVTERERAQQELLANEEGFRSLAENAPVMIWTDDAERNLTWENRTALEFVGRTLAVEAGGGWLEAVHPDDLEMVREHYQATTAEQRGFTLEFRLRRHDGVYRHVLQIAIPRWDAAGRLSGFLGVDVDVTEIKERSLALQEAEARYRQIAETVPVIVWMDDADHRLTYYNPTAERFSGRTLEQEAGRSWIQGVHPDDRALIESAYQETSAHPAPYQHKYRLRRADGTYRWMIEIGVPRYTPAGELNGFVGVDVDIHDLMQASERLEQAETRYRHFIEQSTEGIWRFESDAPISIHLAEDEQVRLFLDHTYLAECNVAMAAMCGYDRPEELIGKRLRHFVGNESAAMEQFLRSFIRSGYRLTDAETIERDRRGRVHHFMNNLVGAIENDVVVRTWGMRRDITERRQLEEEARQARKMETAGRLAGGVAHDFNNLLTAILGTSEMLLQELPPGVPAREDVEEIKRAATRAANLTRQLLAFSRRQVLQPRILDLNQLVHGVETMLRRLIGEHISLMTRTDPLLRRVRADPGQIEQVIVNLCVNARDAMPTGGELRIETANSEFPGASHGPESVMPPGAYSVLSVSDTGTGMEPETLHHLFEPFFTTKELGKGTGLGLATVYGIVKQSGGFIYADSTQGKGSRFRIYFPAAEGELEEVDSSLATPAQPRGDGTILLVEDEEAVRRLTRRVLEGVGYRVLEAANGAEALQLIGRWQGALDLVITDVIMPGMSGQELSTRLRRERPWLKILYVSGYTDDAILQHGTLLPNTAFLHKPFSPASLAQGVRDVLGR